jgi:endogenous inhibitor of DNA gyrase (YacG/DUF329 family)
MDTTLTYSSPCPECGAEMLWTQNAWEAGATASAAFRCVNGHVLDPSTTRQCPACGVHDTTLLGEAGGRQQFQCSRCGEPFTFPR